MRLKSKVSVGITGLVVLSVVAVGGITVVSQQHLLRSEIRQRHESLVKQLARVCEESLYQSNLVFLNYTKALAGERGFRAAFLVDQTGLIQMHSNPALQGQPMDVDISSENPYAYSAFVSFSGKPVGSAHLQFDANEIQSFLTRSLQRDAKQIGFISLLVLALSLPLVLLFTGTMLKPVHDVINGMREISEGRLDPIRVSGRSDELGWMENELNTTIQKLKELEELKTNFIMSVTHDLTSPLNNIQSIHSLLMERTAATTPDQLREHLLNAQNSSDRLMGMIQDLLKASKIQSREVQTNASLFDVRKSIQEVAALYKVEADRRKIRLALDIPSTPAYVYADRDMVSHILLNLVSNAFKFTSKGTVGLSTRENGDDVTIEVRDTGAGIPKSDRDKIFGKFYRSDSNSKQAIGTGLGLFIVNGYVEANRGSIRVDENPGGGTVFRVVLPKEARA